MAALNAFSTVSRVLQLDLVELKYLQARAEQGAGTELQLDLVELKFFILDVARRVGRRFNWTLWN